MTYKVGDRIRIVRVDDSYKGSRVYNEYQEMVGQSYNVIAVNNKGVDIDSILYGFWKFEEIELDKNYYVTEILKDL